MAKAVLSSGSVLLGGLFTQLPQQQKQAAKAVLDQSEMLPPKGCYWPGSRDRESCSPRTVRVAKTPAQTGPRRHRQVLQLIPHLKYKETLTLHK